MGEFEAGQRCSCLQQVRNVLERDPVHAYTILGVGVEAEMKPLRMSLGKFDGDLTLREGVEELRQASVDGIVIVHV